MTVIDEPQGAEVVGDRQAPVEPRPTGWGGASLREVAGTRLWPSALLFLALATLAMLLNDVTSYVGDNRFEQYWNPARRIAKSFTMWDPARGLGRVREDFWPATTLPVAALRALGASPAVAEHLFHALCITLAATGMVAVVRLFRPRIGMEHVLAGLACGFGAYSATFLVPSNLYFHFALAPWLLVVAYRGIHEDRPWRWAAAFALLVFAAGNVDLPGLVYNLVPLVPLALYVVLIDRTARLRDVFAWAARAALLVVLVDLAVIAKLVFSSAALGQRLNDTEAADVAALTSSWPESMRGLGNWLSYFPSESGPGLLKPQGQAYLANPLVIAATFAVPVVALFAVWRSRWRARILFLMTALFSLVILVGAFPRSNPSPLGRQILNAYTNINVLTAFRNTYKIGAGLVIGVSALFAAGVMIVHRSLRRRGRVVAATPFVAALLVLGTVAFPFWSGNLYNPTQRMDAVPAYWYEATEWLDALPDEGRALVLPQTSRTRYRWGWVGDDIFDALLARPHAIATGVPLSTPLGANALEVITAMSNEPVFTPGVLGPMARRLGITEIVLRNDLDWQVLDRPRPSDFNALRRDPDFERVATFGQPGEYTTSELDRTSLAATERNLPPVEVYRLRDAAGGIRTRPADGPVLVSGDAWSWVGMARARLLEDGRPVVYTGQLTAEELRAQVEAGAPVVVTDGNRRRLRVVLSYEPDYSYLLAPDQQLDRPTQSLFRTEGSQSVAWFPDATRVSVSGTPRSIGGTQLWSRPAYAVDGDPRTAWRIRRIDQPFDHVFRVDLRGARDLRELSIRQPLGTSPDDGITAVELRFSDGTTQPLDLRADQAEDGAWTVRFDQPKRVDWVEVAPTAIGPTAQTLGIGELTLVDVDDRTLDLREHVQSPDDVGRAAAGDEALREALAAAPTGWVFTRSLRVTQEVPPAALFAGADSTDEETVLRRRFEVIGDREAGVSGVLRLRADTPHAVIDEIVQPDIRVSASVGDDPADLGLGVGTWPGWVVDGTDGRGWSAPPTPGTRLTLRFPAARPVSSVLVRSPFDADTAPIQELTVSDGTGRVLATVRPEPQEACAAEGRVFCDVDTVVRFPATTTDQLVISFEQFGKASGAPTFVVREVEVDGGTNVLPLQSAPPGGCRVIGVRLGGDGDGRPEEVPVWVGGTLLSLLSGEPVPMEGCRSVRLDRGWHRMETAPNSPIEQVELLTPELVALRDTPRRPAPEAVVDSAAPTRHEVTLTDARKGDIVILDQSFDPGWQAVVDGRPLGRAQAMDAMNGWVLDADGGRRVELRYGPQQRFGYALLVTLVFLPVAVWLVVRRPRSRGDRR